MMKSWLSQKYSLFSIHKKTLGDPSLNWSQCLQSLCKRLAAFLSSPLSLSLFVPLKQSRNRGARCWTCRAKTKLCLHFDTRPIGNRFEKILKCINLLSFIIFRAIQFEFVTRSLRVNDAAQFLSMIKDYTRTVKERREEDSNDRRFNIYRDNTDNVRRDKPR